MARLTVVQVNILTTCLTEQKDKLISCKLHINFTQQVVNFTQRPINTKITTEDLEALTAMIALEELRKEKKEEQLNTIKDELV